MEIMLAASVLGEVGACMQAMFGWVGNHTSGLFADEQEIIADADMSGEKSIEDKYAGQSGTVPSSLCLAGLVCSAVDCFITLYCWCADCHHKSSYRGLLRAVCIWLHWTLLDYQWSNEGMMNMTC